MCADPQASTPAVDGAGPGAVTLRLLATTDLHMRLYPHDYIADRPDMSGGLALLSGLIADARAEVPSTLLFDNGDLIQGNPMGDVSAAARRAGERRPHPAIAALNALRYDAATVGNHEFNFGLDFCLQVYREARFPVVLANVRRFGNERGPLFPPAAMLERRLHDADGTARPIRVGVVGVTPPQILVWDRPNLAGRVDVEDILDAAAREVPRLRRSGADLVVVLCHSGLGPDAPEPGLENAGRLVARLPGVDAVVCGHDHAVHAAGGGPHRGGDRTAPIVNPGHDGSHLGLIDLSMTWDADRWHVTRADVETRPAGAVPNGRGDPGPGQTARILNLLAEDHARTLAHIRNPVGQLASPLTSHFALAGDGRVAALTAEAVRHHANTADVGALGDRGLPLLVSVPAYRAGGRGPGQRYTDIPAGTLRMRHMRDIAPYADTVSFFRVTGRTVGDWLDRAASVFSQVPPDTRDEPLLDPNFPPYDFEVIDRLTWRIDLSAPPACAPDGRPLPGGGRRIRDLAFRDWPVADEDAFILAVTSYRAAGSGGFSLGPDAEHLHDSTVSLVEMLRALISAKGTLDLPVAAPWSFVPVRGASAILETGPEARRHGPLAGTLGLVPCDDAEGATARFRLRLDRGDGVANPPAGAYLEP